EARIEAPLFFDAGHRETAIVVRRIEQAPGRQTQDLAPHRAVHGPGVALLEIGASAAADQQAVAGERHALVVEHIRDATLRVSRRGAHLEIALAELHAIAVSQIAVGPGRAAGCGDADLAAATFPEEPRAGDVVSVHMRV